MYIYITPFLPRVLTSKSSENKNDSESSFSMSNNIYVTHLSAGSYVSFSSQVEERWIIFIELKISLTRVAIHNWWHLPIFARYIIFLRYHNCIKRERRLRINSYVYHGWISLLFFVIFTRTRRRLYLPSSGSLLYRMNNFIFIDLLCFDLYYDKLIVCDMIYLFYHLYNYISYKTYRYQYLSGKETNV